MLGSKEDNTSECEKFNIKLDVMPQINVISDVQLFIRWILKFCSKSLNC